MGHRTGRKFASQVQIVREQLGTKPLAFGGSVSVEIILMVRSS